MSIKKFLGFSLGTIGSSIIGLLSVPILTRLINPEQYGNISLILITINFVTLIILMGLDQGYMREFYEEDNKELLSCTLMINICSLFILALFFLFFSEDLSDFIFGFYDVELLFLFYLIIMFSVFIRYMQIKLRMQGDALLYSLIMFSQSFLNFIFTYSFIVYIGLLPIKSVVLAQVISLVVVLVLLYFKNINISMIWFNYERSKLLLFRVVKYSLPIFFSSILIWVMYSSDQYLLKIFSDSYQLGLYSAANKLCSALVIIQMLVVTYWVPLSLKWNSECKSIKYYEFIFDLSIVMFLIIYILFLFLDKYLIILLGVDYREVILFIPILIIYPIFMTLSEIGSIGLIIKRKSLAILFVSFLCAVVNVLFNAFLIPSYGATGAAIASFITFLLYFYIKVLLSNYYWNRLSLYSAHLFVISVFILLLSLYVNNMAYKKICFFFISIIITILLFRVYNKYRCLKFGY